MIKCHKFLQGRRLYLYVKICKKIVRYVGTYIG